MGQCATRQLHRLPPPSTTPLTQMRTQTLSGVSTPLLAWCWMQWLWQGHSCSWVSVVVVCILIGTRSVVVVCILIGTRTTALLACREASVDVEHMCLCARACLCTCYIARARHVRKHSCGCVYVYVFGCYQALALRQCRTLRPWRVCRTAGDRLCECRWTMPAPAGMACRYLRVVLNLDVVLPVDNHW